MSDEDLRQLERRWRASGDPQDERRWLAARIRAGEVAWLAWELAEGVYAEKVLVVQAGELLPLLEPGAAGPLRLLDRSLGLVEDLSPVGSPEPDRGREERSRFGDERRGVELVEWILWPADAALPARKTLTVRSYGLPPGVGLELTAARQFPIDDGPTAVALVLSGPAERVAAAAAQARTGYGAEERPAPSGPGDAPLMSGSA